MRRYIGVLIATVISLTLSSNVASAYCGAPTDGLVAHWRLEEAAAPYHDDINNFTATVSGTAPTSANGMIQNGISNRAAAGHIETATNTTLSAMTTYSVSFWARHSDYGGYEGMLEISDMMTVSSAFDDEEILVNLPSWSTQTGTYFANNAKMGIDKWNHIVVTYDNTQPAGTHPQVYFNGVLQSLTAAFATTGTYSAPASSLVKIGAGQIGSERRMAGEIDDVRIYDLILDADDVAELFKATAPGHMRFNTETSAVEYCDGDDWVMAGTGSYSPMAAEFDGTNDYMMGTLNNTVTDSNKWSASFWFRNDDYTENDWRFIMDSPNPGDISIDWHGHAGDRLLFSGQNESATTVMSMYSDAVTDDEWHHVLFSVDLSDAGRRHIYIDGASAIDTVTTYDTSGIFDFTLTDYGIGTYTGARMWDGALADLWVDFGTYIDFSSAAQRAKFVSPTGMPMYLGADGSLPTGQTPDIFLSGDVESWHVNKGAAGGFTETGSITASATQPAATSGATTLPSGCSTIGDVCADGSVYAGLSPDGSVAMYTTPADAGTFTYNDGSGNWFNVMDNCSDSPSGTATTCQTGMANTEALIDAETEGASGEVPYAAARYCYDLTAHGYDDWYLPAPDELDILYTNRVAIDGFTTAFDVYGSYYLSSAENWDDCARHVRFHDGVHDCAGKNTALKMRCVRKGGSPVCTGPDGSAGDIIYNTDEMVLQYCNSADWVAMGPVGGTGGGGCSSPAGNAGDIMFNNDFNTMQFCNAQDWVAIGKQTAPTEGLIAHYPLNETSGNSMIEYVSANNGTWTDGTGNDVAEETRKGKIGNAPLFDGNNDFVLFSLTSEMQNLQSFTLSAWVNWAGVTADYQGVIDLRDVGMLTMAFNNSNLLFRAPAWDGAEGIWQFSGNYRGQWKHMVVTYNYTDPVGTDPKVYVDGIRLPSVSESTTPTGSYSASAQTAGTIGRSYISGNGRFYNGLIDDVRIYNRELSDTEIKQLYYATK